MNWKALSSAMRTFYQSDYNGFKLILNEQSYSSSSRRRDCFFFTFRLFFLFQKHSLAFQTNQSLKQDKKNSFSIIMLSQLTFHSLNNPENITNSWALALDLQKCLRSLFLTSVAQKNNVKLLYSRSKQWLNKIPFHPSSIPTKYFLKVTNIVVQISHKNLVKKLKKVFCI